MSEPPVPPPPVPVGGQVIPPPPVPSFNPPARMPPGFIPMGAPGLPAPGLGPPRLGMPGGPLPGQLPPPGGLPGQLPGSLPGQLPGAGLRGAPGSFSKQIYCELHFPEKLMADGSCYSCTMKAKREEEEAKVIEIYKELLKEEEKQREKTKEAGAAESEEKEEDGEVGFADLRESVIDLGKKIATRLMDIDAKDKSFDATEAQSKDYYDTLFSALIDLLQRKKAKYVNLQREKLAKAKIEIKGDREMMATVSKQYMETYKEYERAKAEGGSSAALKAQLDAINSRLEQHTLSMANHSQVQFLPFQRSKEQLLVDMAEYVDDLLRFEWRLKDSFQQMAVPQLHSFQWGSKLVHLYDVRGGRLETREISSQFEIPLYSRSVATEQGRLFLVGGYVPNDHYYLKNCFVYEEKRNNFATRAQMKYPRASHGILFYSGGIYVFGTYMFGTCYKHCERYDVAANRWIMIAEMNVARAGAAFCVFQKNFILAFGGRSKFQNDVPAVDSIEVYNVKLNSWKMAPYDRDRSVWVPAYLAAGFQVSEREVLIFGGKTGFKSTNQHLISNTYFYDVTSGVVKAGPPLVQPAFYTCQPLCVDRSVWLLSNEWKPHKYDVAEKQWTAPPLPNDEK